MNEPLISVVVATRNRITLLREAVHSIRAQTNDGWELLIVDDCSSDETESWGRAVEDARIRYTRLDVHSERSVARNRGLDLARGSHVLFLDDDDRLDRGAVAALLTGITKFKGVTGVIGARHHFNELGHRRREPHVWLERREVIWPHLFARWHYSFGQAAIQTSALRSLGGFRADLAGPEDEELMLRVSRFGEFALLRSPVLQVRMHGQQTMPLDSLELVRSFREEFVSEASEKELEVIEKVRQWDLHRLNGRDHIRERHFLAALPEYVRAVAAAPFQMQSPLLRRLILREVVRSLVGVVFRGPGVRGGYWLKSRARRLLRREPGGQHEKSIARRSGRR